MRIKSNFYYTQLSKAKARELYVQILQAVREHRNTVRVSKADLLREEVLQVLHAVECDYPELFYIRLFGEGCTTTRYGNGDLGVKFRYLFSAEELQKKIQENQRFIRYILSHLPEGVKGSQYSTALWLHDILIRNIRYDRNAAQTGSEKQPDAFTIMGGARSKTAVCSGISRLYQMLCEQEGIWCIYVTGRSRHDDGKTGERHAWNMIRINGRYAHVDVTWDLQEDEKKMPLSHAFFGMSDEQCRRLHVTEPRYPGIRIPPCAEQNPLNYYIYRNSFIRSFCELEQFVKRRIREKENRFSFQIDPQGMDPKVLRSRMEAWMKKYLTEDTHETAAWSWRSNEPMLTFDYVITYRE